jgi:Na+/melibiose symporter-like transporter
MADLQVTVHNERIKLLAKFVNGAGIAVFAVGGLAPMFSSLYGGQGPTAFLLVVSLVCFLAAAALHYGQHHSQEAQAVTTLEMISLLMMPAAGFALAVAAIYFARHIP